MEEIDNIIIHSLRQIGCTVEETTTNLKSFSTSLIIEAVVRCLEVIQPGLGLSLTLPPNLSARFNYASSIAQACQDIGYTGDVGFQTFLYPSENDVRKIFMFLVEKMPKETEKVIVEPAGTAAYLRKAMKEKCRRQLSSDWIPSYCFSKGVRKLEDDTFSREGAGCYQPFESEQLTSPMSCDSSDKLAQAWHDYYAKHLPTVTQNASSYRKLLPTLISLNLRSILANSGQSHTEFVDDKCHLVSEYILKDMEQCPAIVDQSFHNLQSQRKPVTRVSSDPKQVEVNQKPKIAPKPKSLTESREIEKAKEETELLRQRYQDLHTSINTLGAKLLWVSEEKSKEEHLLNDKRDSCLVKKRTYDLLPEADANITKLHDLVENNAQKLVNLATQWEKHRAPLLDEYRNVKQHSSNKACESQQRADAVRILREKVNELAEELRSKEQQHLQLAADYERVAKNISRLSYTRRMMETIGNIRKQKEEIDKVLKDTKELQKEINNLSGQLDRSFTVADELIFKDAKKDDASRKAYKLLATLHSDCSEIVHMVEDTGAIIREIRDLEEQIETERVRNVGANLERITADLIQMKQESAILTVQIKSKS